MNEYRLNVLADGNKQKMYIVQSGNEIPEPILQLAGLLLDQGLFSNEEVQEHLPCAAAHVSSEGSRLPSRILRFGRHFSEHRTTNTVVKVAAHEAVDSENADCFAPQRIGIFQNHE
jgi:hypothetical protein